MAALDGPVAPAGYGRLQLWLGHVPATWRPDPAFYAVCAPSLPAAARRGCSAASFSGFPGPRILARPGKPT